MHDGLQFTKRIDWENYVSIHDLETMQSGCRADNSVDLLAS